MRKGLQGIALLLAVLAPTAFAQEQEGQDGPPDLNPLRRAQPSGEEELKQLFLTVDKRLNRVTELLYEASSGDPSRSSEIGSAGIDELIREAESAASEAQGGIAKLLEASRRQSEAAGVEINRILEIAAQNPQGGQSSSSSSPSDSQSQPQQGQTPSGSRREEKGMPPGGQEQGQQQSQPKPEEGEEPGQEPGGGKPDDGPNTEQESNSDEDPRNSEKGDAANARGTEDWGDLPIHLRSTFQNSVSDDVPPRYRDWVDAYYERLGRSRRR